MTEEQAYSLANEYVRGLYGTVPKVASAMHLVEHDKWILFYKTTWETDEQGLPICLTLLVDGSDLSVRPMDNSDGTGRASYGC
jgi:hypothetical protein